jgi:hypothetical protein
MRATVHKFFIVEERGHLVGRTDIVPKQEQIINSAFFCPNCHKQLTSDNLVAEDILNDQ